MPCCNLLTDYIRPYINLYIIIIHIITQIISVLLSFSFNRCWVIHSLMSAMQFSKFSNDDWTFDSLAASNCVSSAKKRQPTPNCLVMITVSHVYIVKTRGSRTESCGTPNNKHRTSNKASWINIPWEHSFKYRQIYSSTLLDKPNHFSNQPKKNIMVSSMTSSICRLPWPKFETRK